MVDQADDLELLELEAAAKEKELAARDAIEPSGIYKPAEYLGRALDYGSGLMRYPVTQAMTGTAELAGKKGAFTPIDDLKRALVGNSPTITEAAIRSGAPNNNWTKALGLLGDVAISPAVLEGIASKANIKVPNTALSKARVALDPVGYAGAASTGAIPPAAAAVGALTTPLSFKESLNYIKDPDMAKRLFSQVETNPDALRSELISKLKPASKAIYNKDVAPLVEQRSQALQGKTGVINPQDLKGSQTYGELKDYLQSKLTPEAKISYSKPDIQTVYPGGPPMVGNQYASGNLVDKENLSQLNSLGINPYDSGVSVPVSAVEHGTIVPKVNMKDPVELPLEKIQELKKLSQDNAGHAPGTFGTPSNPIEGRAERVLGNEIIKNAPEVADINAAIAPHAERMTAIKSMYKGNPARILNDSESVGNVNNRALRQYLDQNTGTNFNDMAGALAAGRAMNGAPIVGREHGFLGKLMAPAGQGVVRGAAAINKNPDILSPALARLVYSQGANIFEPEANPWTLLPQTNQEDKTK